ncbi:Plasma membrane proteolipid 3 [Cytospora mali]|uniref:Plasma membrane proteolipid 3 n=1 Tax=Cytospora mali TaxID=578113 RepID=A0A194WE68_CYTMA|nr:Plasma membrane proteolipid 3 [Valsa mali]
MANVCSLIFLILITLLFPPVGVALVAGCGVDVLINICLTLLGYIPGHIHAFYILYVYYSRQERPAPGRAPGIYSERVQTGGKGYAPAAAGGYGTIHQQQPPAAPPAY